MTSLTRHLLIIGRLKKHMYNYSQTHNIDMVAFHEAYCEFYQYIIGDNLLNLRIQAIRLQ